MRTPQSLKCIFPFAALLLSGCSVAGSGTPSANGEQPPVAGNLRPNPSLVSGFFGAERTGTKRPGRTWMLRGASRGDLLYVSDLFDDVVWVYSYPRVRLVGELSITTPTGMCADAKGDVWIPNADGHQIFEYAHGGTAPIGMHTLPFEVTYACAINAINGDLAVVNYCLQNAGYVCTDRGGAGSIMIYKKSKRLPERYRDFPHIFTMYFGAYDAAGNLFVDGVSDADAFSLAELPHGADKMKNLTVDRTIYYPGGVQWDGTHLDVGDQQAGDKLTSSIHQIQVTGNQASVVSTTILGGSFQVGGFWLDGASVIGADFRARSSDVRVWEYPTGGKTKRTIGGFLYPFSVVISRKQ